MAGLNKLGALASAAQAARRYVRENPEKADQYLGKAAEFADRRTKGRYSRQIGDVTSKARSAALGRNPAVGGDATDPNSTDPNSTDPNSTDPDTPGEQDRP